MKIAIMRVLGHRSSTPCVVAYADNVKVTWDPRGWDCNCDTWSAGADTCDHVDAIADLLADTVTGEAS